MSQDYDDDPTVEDEEDEEEVDETQDAEDDDEDEEEEQSFVSWLSDKAKTSLSGPTATKAKKYGLTAFRGVKRTVWFVCVSGLVLLTPTIFAIQSEEGMREYERQAAAHDAAVAASGGGMPAR